MKTIALFILVCKCARFFVVKNRARRINIDVKIEQFDGHLFHDNFFTRRGISIAILYS